MVRKYYLTQREVNLHFVSSGQKTLAVNSELSTMDKLKYSTLPRRKKSKHKERKGSTDDTELKPSKADTLTKDKKLSLVSKPWKKNSPRPSREIPAEELPKKMGLDKEVEKLQACEKSVLAALRWFVDVVQKDILVMLPGSTTKVLQEVMELNNHVNTFLTSNESSSVVMSAHSEVNKNLANLIHWADKVVLHGRPQEGQDEAKDRAEAARLSITSLVTAYMDRLKDKQQKLQVAQAADPRPKRTSLPAQSVETPPSPQEPQMIPSTRVSSSLDYNSNSREDPTSLLEQPDNGIPSGHPSPERSFLSSSPDCDETQDLAPPIPPKQGRASMFEFPTNSEPIMNQSGFLDRSFGGSSMSVMSRTSQQSQQSNFSSISSQSSTSGTSMKSFTSSSLHMSDFSSHTSVESNFTRMSVQSMEVLKSQSGSMEITQYSMHERPKSAMELKNSVAIPAVEITDPPALPKKERHYHERKLSDYDNVDPSEATSLKERCAKLKDEEMLHWEMGDNETFQVSDEDERRNSSGYGSVCTQSAEEPPPLPPKIKHIDTYLDLLGGYNEHNFQMEYYNENRQVEYHETTDKYSLNNRENFFHESYNYSSRFPKSPRNSYGSSVETSSEGSYEGSLEGMPPALPLKQKDIINMSPEHLPVRGRFNTCPDMPRPPRLDLKKKSESITENGSECTLRAVEEPASDNTLKPSSEKPEKGQPGLLDLLSVTDHLVQNTEAGEPRVKGGPIDALIVFAADVDRKELVLSEVFLSTYRTVISARELLNKLLYRYRKFKNKSDIKARQANRNAFFLLLRIAGELIGQVEDDILELLMDLVFQLLTEGELMLAKLLRDQILSKIEDNKKAQLMSHKLPISSLGVSVSRATLLDFRSHELAEQMTLMDSELFSKIEVPEVLLWAREQSETLSPNLTIFTEHFNKMSFWVRSLILQETKATDREKLLIKFIKIMKNLKKLNNFNSYLAVLSALDSAPVRRLDWQKQTVEWLKEYSSLIDSSSSFKCYRDALATAEPPCIPYLGLILQDMTFVHIGNPDRLPDSENVNFIKCWQFFNIMDSMRRFKQTQYDNLKKDEKILAFFNDFNDCLDEEAMWQLSKEIKPQGRGKTSRVN